MTATIRVNGESEVLTAATVAGLLEAKQIDIAGRGVAIALNGAVVPRSAWRATRLCPGDSVQIVCARQGG